MRNEFKITFKEPEYIKANNIIICKLQYRILRPGVKYWFNDWRTATGKARCKDNETFDQHIGEKIALAKAENRAYTKLSKELRKEAMDAYNQIKTINDFINKSVRCVDHNKTYISQF